jgi:hypothetical protein
MNANQQQQHGNQQNGRNRQGPNQAQGQVVPVAQPRRIGHPKDHLEVANGVISNIKTNYVYSESAIKTIRTMFRSLQLSDPSRIYVGEKQGYRPHAHPLGAFCRSHYDDLIMYYYQPYGRILDVGASPVRTLSRYCDTIDGQRISWAQRTHMMTPDLDVRDDYRYAENVTRIQKHILDHNKTEDELHENDAHYQPHHFAIKQNTVAQLTAGHCQHAIKKKMDYNCPCTHATFDAIKSVESWYYPGVLEGIADKLLDAYANPMTRHKAVAWIVGNDYYRMALRQINKNEQFKTLLMSREWPDWKLTCYGCETINGDRESQHVLTFNNYNLNISASVLGNPMPYTHQVPLTADVNTFLYEYGQYYLIMELMEIIENGDVPFVLYKMRVTEKDRWSNEQLENMIILPLGFANANNFAREDLVLDMQIEFAPKLIKKKGEFEIVTDDTHNIPNKPIEITKLATFDIKTLEVKPDIIFGPEQELDVFDVNAYTAKMNEDTSKRVDLVERKQIVESNISFIRHLKMQFNARHLTHMIRLRYVNGQLYIVASKMVRGIQLFGQFTIFNSWVRRDNDFTAQASIEDVLKAYKAIGIKSNINSVHQTMVQAQRASEAYTVNDLAMIDAFNVARVIRGLEKQRFETLCSGLL